MKLQLEPFTVLFSFDIIVSIRKFVFISLLRQQCQLRYVVKNKARHNLIDAKHRWRSDWLDGTGSFREPLGQTEVMQIRQGKITHEVCCLAAQWKIRRQTVRA